jgi:hypothetical protein
MVAMAGEQVASSLKRVCLRLALTGRQLKQTLDHGCPGDDLTLDRASPPNERMSGQAAAGATAPPATQRGCACTARRGDDDPSRHSAAADATGGSPLQ